MELEQEATPTKLLSRNAGKFAAAFLGGFAIFVVVVFVSVRVRDGRLAITSSPIRPEIQSPPFAETASELGFVANPAPAPFVLEINPPAARKRTRRQSEMAPPAAAPSARPAVPQETAFRTAEPAVPPPAADPKPRTLVIPAESTIAINLTNAVSTKESQTGDAFRGVLAVPLMADGEVALPAGTAVQGRIVEARRAGLFGRRSVLSLELTAVITPEGRQTPIKTTQWYANGSGGRLSVAFRGKNKNGAVEDTGTTAKGSDILLAPKAAVSFRLMTPVTAP